MSHTVCGYSRGFVRQAGSGLCGVVLYTSWAVRGEGADVL